MKYQDLSQLSQNIAQAASELSSAAALLRNLTEQPDQSPGQERDHTRSNTCLPSTAVTGLSNSTVSLPRLPARQTEYALKMFKLVADVGPSTLPAAFHQRLGTWHALFGAATECEVWSSEWDKIIDQGLTMINQGADRVRTFVRDQMSKAGFPGWAVEVLGVPVDLIVGAGEGELKTGLELARYSGKLGLWARCLSPW